MGVWPRGFLQRLALGWLVCCGVYSALRGLFQVAEARVLVWPGQQVAASPPLWIQHAPSRQPALSFCACGFSAVAVANAAHFPLPSCSSSLVFPVFLLVPLILPFIPLLLPLLTGVFPALRVFSWAARLGWLAPHDVPEFFWAPPGLE